ncbi:MAG: type I methionyl aminopeptidase [Prevotellaceae bacterium]|jgi:methionyl aminopeptidase|nr:type I methionyl aminopeptidase [Prevotellaceae bacterium]
MIYLKTEEEIELMRESCLLVSKTLAMLAPLVQPGVSTAHLDKLAEEFIRDNGALPACKGYEGYPNATCMSINDVVVHGIPHHDIILKEGDILSIDMDTLKNGFCGDSAYTFPVGEIAPEVKKLLETTKASLFLGIEQAVTGNRIGDISNAVQTYCERAGYSVIRDMIGHGLGHDLHEEPEVPNYGKRGQGKVLKQGMVICIEPMIAMGKFELDIDKDGWTAHTRDRKFSAHYEHCVAIRKGKADILSDFSIIENALKNKN